MASISTTQFCGDRVSQCLSFIQGDGAGLLGEVVSGTLVGMR